ncbi:elongation of very long chain fatty acids protein 5 [Aplysia californica]|uniref:Elongation of very long chain fatty acids protein n=1 Tax=Aplysia californica TaxID=6500 RepID=A0ABM0JC36_APLCA|nr:elongation of very long chain fatty acids protein 5 [Aplysia californica]
MAILSSNVNSFLLKVAALPSLPIFIGYLTIIFLSGLWQKKTSPLSLKPLLIVYNFGCCLISAVTLLGFSFALYSNGSIYGKIPSPVLTQVFTLYWITKVIELGDTVFMVLRHRQRQISFLHVYHHASMLLLSDLSRLYYPWPSISTFLAINSFIHVVLYLYYGLTAVNPDNPPKWKKQMTQIQILQFIIGFIIAFYGHRYHHFCVYSMFYGVTMIVLFSNFYYHAYVKVRTIKENAKKKC